LILKNNKPSAENLGGDLALSATPARLALYASLKQAKKKEWARGESTPEMQGKQSEERPVCPPSETRWTSMVRRSTYVIKCYVGMILCRSTLVHLIVKIYGAAAVNKYL
jgi:hypothetical protein